MEPKLAGAGEVADAAGSDVQMYIVRVFRPARLSSRCRSRRLPMQGSENRGADGNHPTAGQSLTPETLGPMGAGVTATLRVAHALEMNRHNRARYIHPTLNREPGGHADSG